MATIFSKPACSQVLISLLKSTFKRKMLNFLAVLCTIQDHFDICLLILINLYSILALFCFSDMVEIQNGGSKMAVIGNNYAIPASITENHPIHGMP